jgi:hypothetical protein
VDERRGLKLLERRGNDSLIRVIGIHDGMFEGLDPIAQSARGEDQRLIDAPVADPDPHFGAPHQFLPGGDPRLDPAPVPVEDGGVSFFCTCIFSAPVPIVHLQYICTCIGSSLFPPPP